LLILLLVIRLRLLKLALARARRRSAKVQRFCRRLAILYVIHLLLRPLRCVLAHLLTTVATHRFHILSVQLLLRSLRCNLLLFLLVLSLLMLKFDLLLIIVLPLGLLRPKMKVFPILFEHVMLRKYLNLLPVLLPLLLLMLVLLPCMFWRPFQVRIKTRLLQPKPFRHLGNVPAIVLLLACPSLRQHIPSLLARQHTLSSTILLRRLLATSILISIGQHLCIHANVHFQTLAPLLLAGATSMALLIIKQVLFRY